MTPRILFNDRNLSKTDCSVLGLIISLTLKNGYCYASNEYLANYVKVSKRTISDSLSKIKRLKYIIVKYENNNRRIYLNTEKIPTKVANQVAKNCDDMVAETCNHNINNKYKNEYKKINKFKRERIVPYWMEHPEVCKSDSMTEEESIEFDKQLDEIRNTIDKL